MKRIVFIISALVILAQFQVNAQCTPGTYPSSGIFPAPDTNGVAPTASLPDAWSTHFYSTQVDAIIPYDTNVVVSGFPVTLIVDSIGILGWFGAPAGFVMVGNTPNNIWYGNSSGCFEIQGTPAIADTGNYVIGLRVFAAAGGFPGLVDTLYYALEVKYNVGIENNVSDGLNDIYPNPFNESVQIDMNSTSKGFYGVQIMDLSGRVIIEDNFQYDGKDNIHTVNTSSLNSGIYMILIRNEEDIIISKKIVKQ